MGCTNLGLLHELALRDAEAAHFYEKGCEGGHAESCTNLGVLYSQGRGVTSNSEKAVELFEKACEGGDKLACTNLGL